MERISHYRTIRHSILSKFLIAFLAVSLVPLFLLGYYSLFTLKSISKEATRSAAQNLDHIVTDSIQLRVKIIALKVEHFLHEREQDLFTLSLIPRDSASYLSFYRLHNAPVWKRIEMGNKIRGEKVSVPLYVEISFVDPSGNEKLKVRNGRVVPSTNLKNVSNPENTLFKCENYFNKTINLKKGEIYVSHLVGYYVTREEQLAGAASPETAVNGKEYKGIIRFATPIYSDGTLSGIVTIALDQCHLMEMTQHILPIGSEFTLFPSYSSGNYAFMFDDEGWIITHPKFWNIRGVKRDGSPVVKDFKNYDFAKISAGTVPFNLFKAIDVHPNYRLIARDVIYLHRSGITSTFNVGHTERVMAYAPIFYNRGEYKETGVFGGIVLGACVDSFHSAAKETARKIDLKLVKMERNTLIFFAITGFSIALIAVVVARHFSEPIKMLMNSVESISRGNYDLDISVSTRDEIEALAEHIHRMAKRIKYQTKLEQELSRTNRLSSLGILAAGLAHEIRNPITGINLLLDDLHDRMRDHPEERKLMQKALNEIERLDTLVHELLLFARPAEPEFVETDVSEFIESTLIMVRKQCRKQGIAISIDVEDNLPKITMDKNRIKQAILNIILNAMRAMPEGGVIRIWAKIIEQDSTKWLETGIQDSGHGIPPEDLEFIFDPFFSRTSGGIGLGLTIAYSIVRKHNGNIVVESKEGSGATFRIHLPVSNDLSNGPGEEK